jgi:hypothetical protein
VSVVVGPQFGHVIEETHHGSRPAIGSQPRQDALACLPGAVDKHHTGIGKRLGDEALCAPRDQVGEGSHASILPHNHEAHGHLDGYTVVTYTHDMWSFGPFAPGQEEASYAGIGN